eukprot:Em0011g769a
MVPSLVPVVTTSSYGNSIAGSVYTLVCMVKVVDGLVVVPDVVWMKDGGVLVNGTNIILTRTVSGGNSTLNLTFNPLLTSHGGQYTCVATISVPQLSLNITNSSAVTVSVQTLPPPVVTTSSYGSTIAGSVYSLVCMVKVVDGLVVNPDVVWMKDGGVLVNGTNTTLTRTVLGGNSNLNLIFNPLLTSHGGQYICVATISVPQLSLSVTNSSAVTVSVQTLPPPVVTTSSYGSTIAGSVYSLVCMVKVVDGLVVVPDVVWMKDGGVLVNGTNTTLTRTVLGGNSTLNLTFNRLLTSHGGQYTCVATISVPQLSLNVTNSSAATVSVQIPLPSATIVSVSPGSLVVSGIPISIFCAFSIPSVVETSVMVKTFWIRLNQTLNNGDRIKISTSQSMVAYNTTLQITPVNISDTGMYQCVGSISSNSSYVVGSSNASANISLSVQALPPPVVTTSSYGSTIAGSVYSLVCMVKVVDGLVVVPDVVWMKDGGALVNGTNTTLTRTVSGGNSTLNLTFNSLLTSHGGQYICVATISVPQLSLNITHLSAATVSVQTLPPPVVTTSSYGNSIAGSVYSLVCMVKVVDGLVVVPDVVWMKDGGVLVNGTNTTLTRTVLGGNSNLNLTFNPLLTSHGGQYTCVGTMFVPQLSLNVTNSSAAPVSVQIPLPSATIVFVSPGSLVVSGIPIGIFCTFSIPSVVDTSIMVKTFWIRLNQTLNNGDRIKISTSQSMVAYNTTLQITPVNISDTGMYQCVGSISSNSSYVVGSSNASANISLSVQALPPPLVTTSSYGSTIAGSVYSLVCTVKVIDGLVVVPDVMWMKDGRVIVNGTNTTLTRTVSGGNSTINLTFNPLLTSHGGQYICVAAISVPQLSLSVTNSSTVTVSVQIPVPSVTLSPVPLGSSVYTGTSISMSCAFTVPSVVDSPVMLNTLWIGPQGPIYIGNRTMATITQSMMVYTATLQINPSNTSDTGIYWCVGNISSNSSYIVTSSNASANASLTVQALPPPVVTTSSYGNSIAGSVYSLVCMVKVVDGLVVVPDVVWMKDGGVLVNGTNTTLTRTVLGGNSNLNLTFNPLLTSHGGQYTCVATMSVPQLSLNVTNSSAAPVSVQIPLPSATIVFVSPGSLVVSGIPIGIFCTFSIPSVVDTSIMVKTFWIRLNQTLNNGDRIKISTSQSMVAYNTTLQITPVNISDTGMYQCVGSISSNSSYVVGSSNASANISLSVQALPPPLVTTSSYGSTIAGSVYSLVCTVKVIDGLVVVPDVMWMKDGRVIVNGTNTTLTRTVSGGNSTLNLTFNPLLTSHGGQYICVAAISVPQLSLSVTNSSTVTVSVQTLPPPVVTTSSYGSTIAGSVYSLVCMVKVVDGLVVVPDVVWMKDGGVLVNGTNTTLTRTVLGGNSNLNLTFNPLLTSHGGQYTCVATISVPQLSLNVTNSSAAPVSVQIPLPSATIVFVSPGSLVVSGIPIGIFCTFSIPSVVDTSVMVKTFWIRLNQTLNNGDRIKISTSQSMVAYNTTLQITPVNISDTGMYQCVGSISSNSSYVVGSSNASANISLSVQALPPPLVTTSSYGSTIVGSVYSLVCMVKVVDGLVVNPDVVWMKDGGALVNGTNTTLTRTVSGGNSTLNLTFSPLLTSQGGQYTCVATISVPQLSLSVTNSSAVTVSVQTLPPPVVTTSSYGSTIAGLVYSLQCMVKVVDGLVVVPDVVWMKDGGVLVNGTNTTLTRTMSGGNSTLNLTFNPLLTSHGGQYTCVATISIPQLSLSITNSDVSVLTNYSIYTFPYLSKDDSAQYICVANISLPYKDNYISSSAISEICLIAPDSVRGAKIDIVSDTNVFALWSSPWKTNGILRGYRVTCTVLEDYNKPCCYCCCKLKPKRYEIYELNQPERGVSRLKENMSTTDMAELDSIRHKGVHPDRRVPISLSCFRDHVEKMRGDENNGFQLEFECLKSEPDKSDHIDSSQLPCNQVKNRFCNILPYDASRVKLKELNDIPGSDYINASYIDGYNCQKIYIAAQGPTDETVNDFWRMVWEKRLGTIVMLTRCIESGTEKCAQYWASTNGNHETARFKVTTISASQFADYTITSLVVSDKEKSEDELLHVKHFHFTSWPDHGVPDTPSSLVTFIKYVQKNCKFTEESPLLVHCSAGVGRSGTFIALHILLERIKTEDSINVFECVNQMRKRRPFMVQSLVSGKRLAQDSTNSTYINASRIQGYKLSCMYIATQGPLSNTVNDFWKMIMEQECKTIVMLCELMEEGEESCACYWPTAERPVNFGTLSIHLLSVIIRNGIIFRNFKLTENTNELLVAQYCYSEWPQHGKPASLPNLLTLLDTLNKALSASERNVITVVCNDGCGRTGSFICIHSELERLKAEGVVNIFQSVKAMRSYRPGMVQDVGQYAFCHDVLASCVDGMSTLVGRMVPPTPSPTPTRDHVLELEVVGMCLLALLPNTPLLEPNDHCLHCCREQITSWYASQCLLSSLSEVTRNFSKVTIRWEKVPCVDQNSVIVGYRVLYGAVTSGVGWAIYSSGMT